MKTPQCAAGAKAWRYHQGFKRDHVARWRREWQITAGQVRDWIAQEESRHDDAH